MKSKFALLLAVLMIFPLCACGDENVEDATQTPEYSIKYDVKINPEFTVYADSLKRMTKKCRHATYVVAAAQ